jgi:polyribonucleotide nucleotidyltransferase
MFEQKEYSLQLGDESLVVKTGMIARQANATVLCQMGDTVSMSNVTVSSKARSGVDFLPLQLVYQEKFYAGGRIGGSRFRKREGRPADSYVLMGRVIDRGLRPMLPKHMRNDIQVFCTVLSYDFEHEHDVASTNAANLAMAISDCPADGPLGSVRVGMIGGELVLNPSREARTRCDLDLFLTASLERIVMIEAAANQLPEEDVLKAIEFGKKWAQKIAAVLRGYPEGNRTGEDGDRCAVQHDEALKILKAWALPAISKAIKDDLGKAERRAIFNQYMNDAAAKLEETYGPADDKEELTLSSMPTHPPGRQDHQE